VQVLARVANVVGTSMKQDNAKAVKNTPQQLFDDGINEKARRNAPYLWQKFFQTRK